MLEDDKQVSNQEALQRAVDGIREKFDFTAIQKQVHYLQVQEY